MILAWFMDMYGSNNSNIILKYMYPIDTLKEIANTFVTYIGVV